MTWPLIIGIGILAIPVGFWIGFNIREWRR